MIEELLQWVVLASAKKETALVKSNLLLIMYCLSYLTNSKGRYLAVFILCELVGASSFFDWLDNVNFYCFLCLIYIALYYECHKNKDRLLVLIACATMALFELSMSYDAIIYPNTETAIWHSYATIVFLIHCAIILSTTNFSRIRLAFLSTVRYVCDRYNFAFIMYNIGKTTARKN